MIDIHTHLIYGVDDGARSFDESKAMLAEAGRQGVTDIIATPHFRRHMFAHPRDRIVRHFEELRPVAEQYGVTLHLGCEYHVDSDCVDNMNSGRCHTLAGSSYVLAEYGWSTEASYIRRSVQELLADGYIPVIAHVERYECMLNDRELAGDMQEMGALIQVNADAVLGMESWKVKRYTRYLIRNNLVDIIASDSHGITKRACHMKQCYEYIMKKHGEETAGRLFTRNPSRILQSINTQQE